MKQFIVREEYFGGAILNRKNLTTRFIDQQQLEFLKARSKKNLEGMTEMTTDEATAASHLQTMGVNTGDAVNYDVWEMKEDRQKLPQGILKSPLRVYFEITRLCNLRCKGCFSSSGKELPGTLTTDEVHKVIDNLRAAEVLEARITGGEPTKRSGWQDIVAHAKSEGMAVSLNSNGVYDNEVRDQILKQSVDQVIISLDGLKEAHEKNRGTDTYDKTLKTIQYLSERANNVRINTILKEESLPDVRAIARIAVEMGTEMCFILLRPVGRGADLMETIPSLKSLYRTMETIRELKAQYPNTRIMTSFDVMQSTTNRPAPGLDLTGCAAGLRGMNILSNGRMECCGFMAELSDKYSPGNVRDQGYSVLHAWRASPEMQAFRDLNRETGKRCNGCEAFQNTSCLGSCAAMSIYKEVNPTGKDPYCMKDVQQSSIAR